MLIRSRDGPFRTLSNTGVFPQFSSQNLFGRGPIHCCNIIYE